MKAKNTLSIDSLMDFFSNRSNTIKTIQKIDPNSLLLNTICSFCIKILIECVINVKSGVTQDLIVHYMTDCHPK